VVEYHTSLTFSAEVYQEAAKLVQKSNVEISEEAKARRRVLAAICIAVLLSLVFLINEFPLLADVILPIAYMFLGFIMCVVFLALYSVKMAKATYLKQHPVELSYIFRDHAFEVTQPFAHAIYSWQAIKSIIKGDKYWLMMLTNNENLFHPLDAQAMSPELKDFLVRKVKERKDEELEQLIEVPPQHQQPPAIS
jgi:hypothetical protein